MSPKVTGLLKAMDISVKGFYCSYKPASNQTVLHIRPEQYPRTLIISAVPCAFHTGSAALMARLFNQWPKRQLAQIYGWGEPVEAICENNFCVGRPPRQSSVLTPQLLLHPRALMRYLRDFSATLLYEKRHDRRSKSALEWARQWNPDVIYTYALGNASLYHEFAQHISQELNIPYVVHVMDDWHARIEFEHQDDAQASEWPAQDRKLRRLFADAAGHLGISREMQMAYRERFGHDFVPVANVIDVGNWTPFRTQYDSPASRPFRFAFLGKITPEKDLTSLKRIALAIKELAADEGVNIELIIYGASDKLMLRQLVDNSIIQSGGPVPDHLLPSRLAEADALVVAINFNEFTRRYLGLSIQNKIPEYLASGSPVLAYGPPGNPSIEYARRDGWAEVVDTEDLAQLKNAIHRLVTDKSQRQRLGSRGRQLVMKNHSREIVASRFLQALNDAIGTSTFSHN